MTQRDRLRRLISDMQDGGNKQGDHIMHTGFISNEKLTDYLLANGVIVPPCKVDDTVYEIQPMRKRVQAYKIISVKYNGRFWTFYWVVRDGKGIYVNVDGFDSNELGKTVFLTRAEAEKALKERGEPNKCWKCVNEVKCKANGIYKSNCPDYKRDAPDGGYYG